MMSKNVQIRKNAIRSYSRNLKAGQKLTNNHGIIYDIFLGSRRKVGEISAGVGKTPEQAIEDRYGSGSNRDEAIIVHRLHIFDKDTVRKSFAVNKRGFDKTLHDRINFYNAANKIKVPFFVDTLADGVSYDGNTNNEALIGFDKKHQKKLDMLVAEFLDPNKTKNHAQSLKEEIVPRGYQANTLTKAIRVLLDEHICLFHCFPGWGKSTIGLYAIVDLAHQTKNINKNKACNIAVYSPIIDTLEGFVESAIANNYFNTKINVYTTDDILTLEKEGVNLKKRFNSAKGGINLFVLSVQGVRFADPENSEINKTFTARTVRKRYAFLNEIDLFAQIRDERHKEYGGEITSEVFENIKSEYCLDLTATPYGLLQNQEYTEEQIVCDSMLHALREKKRGNKFYADFPEISIKAIGPAQMVRENKEFCGLYTDEEDWDPRKFLDHNGKNFKLEAAIIDFLDKTIGRQGLLPKSKNPMTIINDDISPLSKKTIMLVVPEDTGGRGVKDNVPALVELVNNSPQVASRYHAVSSYELTKNRKIKPKVAIEKLREKHGKDILVITHRKMTTGSDVPPMGAIIMLDKMANPGEFEQLLGRIFRSYDGKESTRIYVFCPGMNISHVVCSMAKDAAKYDDDPEKAETEIFDCLPITLVDDLQTSIVSYDEAYRGVLEETKRLMSGDYYTQSFFDKFPLVHDAIKGLEFIPLKKGPKGTAISPKNKSKISSRKPKTKAEEKKEKKERKLWKETLTVMLNEVPMIGYSSGSVTVEDIFETELANALFGLENCQVMLHALAYGGDFSRAINISYTEMIDTINDLDDEEVFNKIYRNEQYKTDQGLVYTPMALARELLSHRNIRRLYEKCLQNGKEFAIIVPNALSGAIPLVARELYPEAKITCVEYFPYYIDYLRSYGFKVIDLEENVENFVMNRKFDVVIGNPPYLKGKWITFLKKSTELAEHSVLMIAPDGTNNFSVTSNSLCEFLINNGLQSKNDCTDSFKGVNTGSIVVYHMEKDKEGNPDALIDSSEKGRVLSKIIDGSGRVNAILSTKRSKKATAATRYTCRGAGRVSNIESVKKTGLETSWIDASDTTVIDGNKYWLTNRFFGSQEDSPLCEVNGKVGISYNVLAIERIPGWNIDDFKRIYLSDPIRFALTTMQKGQFDASPRHLRQLPLIPKKTQDIYKHLKLNKKDRNVIENAVK